MISDQLRSEVLDWIDNDPDTKTANQLTQWLKEENQTELERCFAGFLQFGTAGLRGPMGPGPSCMNRAVVIRTASGILEFNFDIILFFLMVHVNNNGNDRKQKRNNNSKGSSDNFDQWGVFWMIDAQ